MKRRRRTFWRGNSLMWTDSCTGLPCYRRIHTTWWKPLACKRSYGHKLWTVLVRRPTCFVRIMTLIRKNVRRRISRQKFILQNISECLRPRKTENLENRFLNDNDLSRGTRGVGLYPSFGRAFGVKLTYYISKPLLLLELAENHLNTTW